MLLCNITRLTLLHLYKMSVSRISLPMLSIQRFSFELHFFFVIQTEINWCHCLHMTCSRLAFWAVSFLPCDMEPVFAFPPYKNVLLLHSWTQQAVHPLLRSCYKILNYIMRIIRVVRNNRRQTKEDHKWNICGYM